MQLRSEKTRAAIMDTAEKLFASQGYDATSVAEICAGAEISKGAFFHHFPTKHDLFMELMERWLASLDAGMSLILDQSTNVPQGLLDVAAMSGMIFRKSESSFPMFLEFWSQSIHNPLVWQAAVSPYRRYQEKFEGIIRRGIAEGSLDPGLDPDAAARELVALAVGLFFQAFFDPEGAVWDDVLKESVQLLLNGWRRRPE
ncbi:MAG TPA: TetR/AcrR family transcriptional regulator [Anaerolineaceae bacterium]|nr:TetR/AcrR family transcriptional regulator [Anaerolineaceae bacterium]HPN52840.1 TetR/AcrR family transcriptional regulator [Anaerolineaceae bacterium]